MTIRLKIVDIKDAHECCDPQECRVCECITAALAAADEREMEFERAREAWNTFQSECNCEDDMETVCRHHDIWNRAEAILDAYFNPAKEG